MTLMRLESKRSALQFNIAMRDELHLHRVCPIPLTHVREFYLLQRTLRYPHVNCETGFVEKIVFRKQYTSFEQKSLNDIEYFCSQLFINKQNTS